MTNRPLRAAPLIDPFEVGIPACDATVRSGLRQVMDHLKPLALGMDDAGKVEIILAEALNNIVEHALEPHGEDTEIWVRCTHARDGLHLLVIDKGRPMPNCAPPGINQPDVDVAVDNLPEGGFGWFMIHTLAQDVSYSRINDANHLYLRVSVSV